jgi:hypothetical protein
MQPSKQASRPASADAAFCRRLAGGLLLKWVQLSSAGVSAEPLLCDLAIVLENAQALDPRPLN